MLFVSFWHLGLENIPEGTFTHRRVSPEQAKQMIDGRARPAACVASAKTICWRPTKNMRPKITRRSAACLGSITG